MTAAELLEACGARGVTVEPAGGWLDVSGPDEAVDELLPAVREHKGELLTLLGALRGRPKVWCSSCARPTDEKRRCWHCHDRSCEKCDRPTGSAVLALCLVCDWGTGR